MITDVSFSSSTFWSVYSHYEHWINEVYYSETSSSLQRESLSFSSPSTRNELGLHALRQSSLCLNAGVGKSRSTQRVGVYEHSMMDQSDFKGQLAWCPNFLTKRSYHFISLNLFPLLQMANMMLTCRAILGIKWNNVYFKGNHGRLLFLFLLIYSQWPQRNGNSYIKFWNLFPTILSPPSLVLLPLPSPLCDKHREQWPAAPSKAVPYHLFPFLRK